jgi:alkylation response protein AidB-like acyl-CoA dehydrogenase
MDTDLICALRENARRVLTDRCASDQLHRFVNQETDRYDAKLWRTAAELGWLALAVTEEHGGLGAGIVEVAALQEELGRFLAPVPFHSCALVARALALWPRDVIRAEWLPRLATGEIIGAVGPFFPSSSSLTAVRSSSAWKIKGECVPVLDGEIADVFLVSVSTEAGPGIAFVGRSTGLAVCTLSVADRTRTVATLHCQNIEVPADHLLCGSEAAALSERLADEARILIASDSLGGAQAILDTTVEYLKARVQFGKPIGSFQALKHRCADHKVSLEASKRLLGRAMLEFGTTQRATWTSLAKFSACDCYAALAADGVQMHGGIGFTWEHNAHLFLKRALLNQFLFGDSAQQQDRAAQLLIAAKQPL